MIDTSVKAPSHEASSGFVIKVQTSYDDRALVQFEDRFEFTFHSRPDCSFQPHNPRLEVGPTGGAPLIVRAVNYSSEPWLKPMAMLDDAGIPVSFRDITANINGVQRQVLLVTFDRKALSDVFGQRRSVPQKVQLSIYDTRTDFLAKKVGTLAIPVVFAKIFDLHPASVFWTPGQSKPVTLIAVCRSCPDDLSADDFEVTLGETPLKNVEIEALKGGWSRLRVVIPAALSELNGDPSIVVRVPRLGYAGTTAVRIAEPK